MNPIATPLQTILGLWSLNAEVREPLEVIIALVGLGTGIALRRRHWVFSAPSFWMLAIAFVLDLLTPWTQSVSLVWQVMGAGAVVAFFWAAIWFLMDAAGFVAMRGREHFSTIFKDVLTFLLFTLVVMAVLWADFGVNPLSLAVTFGAASVVVGLALQETLGNVFSGLALQLQKPFNPGDWVRTGQNVGRVQGTNLRATTIITRANERLDIPNTQISKEVLINYTTGMVADEISVGIAYGVPPNRVREVTLRVLRDVPHVLVHPQPDVLPWSYGDFSIQYRVKYWIADWTVQERVHADVVANLWYALRRHGIEIPFPIRTLELRRIGPKHAGEAQYEHEIVAALRELYFLKELPDNELRVLVPAVQSHQFGAGEVLMRQGDEGDTMYILRRGTVEILIRNAEGKEIRVNTLTKPHFIGEMALLTGEPRTATVRALTDVEVLEMNRDGLMRLFKEHPETSTAISEIVAARQAQNVQALQKTDGEDRARSRRRWVVEKIKEIFDLS
jgi:small-conductance mechanosensitive channel/CRP-like cAMP-binding protein